MTDPELQELAELWQEPGGSAEVEDFDAVARRARRQAKLLAFADLALLGLLALTFVLASFARPDLPTLAVGGVTFAAILWISWKRREHRQLVTRFRAQDHQSFMASSIKLATGNLRRVRFSLFTFPPVILLAILFNVSRKGDDLTDPLPAIVAWAQSTKGFIALTILALLVLGMLRSLLKAKAELRRLHALSDEYAAEARHDAGDA